MAPRNSAAVGPESTVINVEGLAKRYLLNRQRAQPYTALRDVLAEGVARVGAALFRPFPRAAVPKPRREEFWALKDVSFQIKRGETVGIIGRNGAGKSTLLKILSRITEPTQGRVGLRGRVASLLEVGTGFHPELTGRENIFLNGAILGMGRSEIQRKFDEIVDFAEVRQFLDTPVKHYSSGMYVRLAFAVAAHLEPEILVVDEVLAVGDAPFQKKCLGKMEEVGRGGRTVLFVSHNMNAIEQLCTSALLLDKGRVHVQGRDVRAVIKEYLFSADDSGEASEWRNAGHEYDNPWFKPWRFAITDEEGNPQAMPIANDRGVFIQIEAEIQELDPALTVGYAIYSEEGILLYWSYQTDKKTEEWPELKKGPVLLRSQIPKQYLNEGIYKLELIGGLHFRQWLFEPGVRAPSIFLTIQGRLSDSPYWMMRRPGVLAPAMTWTST